MFSRQLSKWAQASSIAPHVAIEESGRDFPGRDITHPIGCPTAAEQTVLPRPSCILPLQVFDKSPLSLPHQIACMSGWMWGSKQWVCLCNPQFGSELDLTHSLPRIRLAWSSTMIQWALAEGGMYLVAGMMLGGWKGELELTHSTCTLYFSTPCS